MANEETYLKLLALRDIKPTANRLLVLREMLAADRAFSLLDLEDRLVTMDKSTIFRTITLPLPRASPHPRHRRRFGVAEVCPLQQRLQLRGGRPAYPFLL